MALNLTLRPRITTGDRHHADQTRVWVYDVLGLPPGETGVLEDVRENGRWQISRNGGPYYGDHDTAEKALAALRDEFS